jgi:hypothetical protein
MGSTSSLFRSPSFHSSFEPSQHIRAHVQVSWKTQLRTTMMRLLPPIIKLHNKFIQLILSLIIHSIVSRDTKEEEKNLYGLELPF